MNVLNWIGEHPFLCFFALMVVADLIRDIARAKWAKAEVTNNSETTSDSSEDQ